MKSYLSGPQHQYKKQDYVQTTLIKKILSCTKLHIRKNPISWTPLKDTEVPHFVKDNAEEITEEGRINENIIQENVNHSDNQDCNASRNACRFSSKR